MLKNASDCREDQARRLQIKTLGQQLKRTAVDGTGLSPWEAEVLVSAVEEIYFTDPELQQAADGQLRYQCVSSAEGAGKPLSDCRLQSVLLTLFDPEDEQDLMNRQGVEMAGEIRRRRLVRITDEAREQGGLLSQEDAAKILMCDVRTIRRDVKLLREQEIVVATRGQQKDIGPGVSHRGLAIRHWLEGKEPVAVATQINHSVKAVENYVEKFKRVVYVRRKGFQKHEVSLTCGISLAATQTFLDLYDEFRSKAFFKSRLAEINLVGNQYYFAEGEKKDSRSSSATKNGRRSK